MTHALIDPPSRRSPLRSPIVAVICMLALAACGNPPSPTPSPTASPSLAPSASPSTSASAEPVACSATDLTATGGPWGGAAGSRGSDVVVENHGSAACLLPAAPTAALVDAGGAAVLSNAPAPAGSGPALEPGSSVGFSVVLGNWCDQAVALPLKVSLALASGSLDVANLAIPTVDELPPCNGPGQPATLSTTPWGLPPG